MRYQLALAQLQAGSPQQAKTELKEAVTIAPNFADAVLPLAEINLMRENADSYGPEAIDWIRQKAESMAQNP